MTGVGRPAPEHQQSCRTHVATILLINRPRHFGAIRGLRGQLKPTLVLERMVKATALARFMALVMTVWSPWSVSAQQVQSTSPPTADQPHQHSTEAHADLFPAREASGREDVAGTVQSRWTGLTWEKANRSSES